MPLKMQIPGQPETLSLVNTTTYLSLILRLPAQWVHQQARMNLLHCHRCPCEVEALETFRNNLSSPHHEYH